MGSSWHHLGRCYCHHLMLLLLSHSVRHWLLGAVGSAATRGWQHHVTQGLAGCEAPWPELHDLCFLLLAAASFHDGWCRMQAAGPLGHPGSHINSRDMQDSCSVGGCRRQAGAVVDYWCACSSQRVGITTTQSHEECKPIAPAAASCGSARLAAASS